MRSWTRKAPAGFDEDRPYICRTQGLPLRWLDVNSLGEEVELRDICPHNEEGTPLEELELWQCWSLGIMEPRLLDLQEVLQQAPGGTPSRVGMRSLFAREVG